MTRYFLTKLTVEGFRGINNESDPLVLVFKPDAVNSVFGPNGLGKSSIFEALAYAIAGKIQKLEGLPAADEAESYYVNRFHSKQSATIGLTFLPDDGSPAIEIQVNRSPSATRSVSSPSGHPDPAKLLDDFAAGGALLDYKTFGQFVEDTPLRRGRTFSGLVGLGPLSEFRQILEALAHGKALKGDFALDTLDAECKGQEQQTIDALARIRSAYRQLIGSDMSEPLNPAAVGTEVCAALANVALLNPFVEVTPFDEVRFADIRVAIKKAEGSERRDRLAEVLQEHGRLANLGPEDGQDIEQRNLRALVQKYVDAISLTRGPLYLRMYEAAETLLTNGDWAQPRTCPLCDSADLGEPISVHVTTHLSVYVAVQEAELTVREKWTTQRWVARIKALAAAVGPPERIAEATALDEAIRLSTLTVGQIDKAMSLLDFLESTRVAKIGVLESERRDLERELPPSLVGLTEQVELAERLQLALTDHRRLLGLSTTNRDRLARRLKWCSFIEDASRDFADAEVALSTAQTLAIEADYRNLYEQVTRNPDVVPTLRKASGSEELHLRLAKFHGLVDLSASTILPESYRNALAICIFLAAMKKSLAPPRFIVFDDITSSFDNGHQFNLMELIRTVVAVPANPAGPQVILLSHDGALEKYFDTVSAGAGWHHQKLQGAPPEGAVLTQPQDAQRLRSSAERFLKAGQVQQGAPLLRQYLEYSMLQVIRKVKITVPLDFSIRDDRKMVGNCLDAIETAVKLHKSAGRLILDQAQQDSLTKALVPKLVSNWVNHYATGSSASLSPYVLLGVLTDVDDFVDCFRYSCRCSGQPPRRFYDGLAGKYCAC